MRRATRANFSLEVNQSLDEDNMYKSLQKEGISLLNTLKTDRELSGNYFINFWIIK